MDITDLKIVVAQAYGMGAERVTLDPDGVTVTFRDRRVILTWAFLGEPAEAALARLQPRERKAP